MCWSIPNTVVEKLHFQHLKPSGMGRKGHQKRQNRFLEEIQDSRFKKRILNLLQKVTEIQRYKEATLSPLAIPMA